MSTDMPAAVLRRALGEAFARDQVAAIPEKALIKMAESIERQGYLIVSRADAVQLRADAALLLRYVPASGARP